MAIRASTLNGCLVGLSAADSGPLDRILRFVHPQYHRGHYFDGFLGVIKVRNGVVSL